VQIVTTLARGGAQATVLASSGASPSASDGSGGSGHSTDAPAVAATHPVEVTVLAGADTTGEGSFWDDPALDSIDVEVVPHLLRSIRPLADLRALWWLVRRLRADRPDVVHTHSSKAGVLGRLAAAAVGVPCVHTVHGWGPLDAASGSTRRVVILLERGLARLSAALVVVGRGDLDRGLDLGIGRAWQYRLIRSGIELPDSADPTIRTRVRRDLDVEGRWVVGMVGRLAAQKDQATLIDAVANAGLADTTLVLIGDGPKRSALEAHAAAHSGLDVRFLGPRPDGADLVAGFDVAVNASHWEGLPRTVVEAAAAGVPVIASDLGSTDDLIEPGRSGRLVPPGDTGELTKALVAARRDRAETAAMAAEAARRARDFSADRMRSDLCRLWSEVSRAGRPQRPGPGNDGMVTVSPDLGPTTPAEGGRPGSVSSTATSGATPSSTNRSTNQATTPTTAAVVRGSGSPEGGTGRMRTRRWLRTRLPRIW
ncbi:MAG: glycosyltransferase, partial [Actinomycetota bacterium]